MKSERPSITRRLLLIAAALLLPLGQVQAAPPGEAPFGLQGALSGLQRAIEVQQQHLAGLLSRPGVVGIGIVQNPAGRPVIRILTAASHVAGLPQNLEGVDVEAQFTGRLVAQQALTPAERWPRPVPIGVSVAHPDVTVGTLGARVQRGRGTQVKYYVLSNNHVLANGNLALLGDATLQPGPYDGGLAPGDIIARLTDFQAITMTTTANNTMDAAIAEAVSGSVDFQTPADGYGAPVTATLRPSLNLPVMKYGRTTALTNGTITGVNFAVLVDYGNGQTARFVNQIIITGSSGAFSRGGDSGSLVVASSGRYARRAVGLLFAGNDTVTVASPIKPILSRFGVSISGQ